MPRDRQNGRRYPTGGAGGIYLSLWANVEDLEALDALGGYWGMDRSKTIKRAVAEAQDQAVRFKTGPKTKPRIKGQHQRKRGS